VQPWAAGGPTDLDNLISLCGVHHRLVHEGGWRLHGSPNGRIRFFSPDGTWFEQGPPAMRERYTERLEELVGAGSTGGPAP
jgi:hypothetical protein